MAIFFSRLGKLTIVSNIMVARREPATLVVKWLELRTSFLLPDPSYISGTFAFSFHSHMLLLTLRRVCLPPKNTSISQISVGSWLKISHQSNFSHEDLQKTHHSEQPDMHSSAGVFLARLSMCSVSIVISRCSSSDFARYSSL